MSYAFKVLALIENYTSEIEFYKLINKSNPNCEIDFFSIKYSLYSPNFLRYDLIVLPYCPTVETVFSRMLVIALLSGVKVVSLGSEQFSYSLDYISRKRSHEFFAKYEFYMCSYSPSFTHYLESVGFPCSSIIKLAINNTVFEESDVQADDQKFLSNTKRFLFAINFDLAFASQKLIKYRIASGYDESELTKCISYQKDCMNALFNELHLFAKKNPDSSIAVIYFSPEEQSAFNRFWNSASVSSLENIVLAKMRSVSYYMKHCHVLVSACADISVVQLLSGRKLISFAHKEMPNMLKLSWSKSVKCINNLNLTATELLFLSRQSDFDIGSYYNSDNVLESNFFDSLLEKNNKNITLINLCILLLLRIRISFFNFKNTILKYFQSIISKKGSPNKIN